MTQSTIDAAVSAFQAARETLSHIQSLPEAAVPASLDEAYAIQHASIATWGKPVAGWKIGATNPPALELFGLDEAFLGPIFENTVYSSPAQLRAADFHHMCLESEFAFRLGRDLPAREAAYTHKELRAAVAEVIPVFELISPRFTGIPKGDGAGAIADCGVGGGLVLGTPHIGCEGLDLVNHAVSLHVGGNKIAEGTGAAVMEDPFNALQWAAGKCAALGHPLKVGDIVSTGTCTGVTFVEAGQECVADFGTLGTVRATFS